MSAVAAASGRPSGPEAGADQVPPGRKSGDNDASDDAPGPGSSHERHSSATSITPQVEQEPPGGPPSRFRGSAAFRGTPPLRPTSAASQGGQASAPHTPASRDGKRPSSGSLVRPGLRGELDLAESGFALGPGSVISVDSSLLGGGPPTPSADGRPDMSCAHCHKRISKLKNSDGRDIPGRQIVCHYCYRAHEEKKAWKAEEEKAREAERRRLAGLTSEAKEAYATRELAARAARARHSSASALAIDRAGQSRRSASPARRYAEGETTTRFFSGLSEASCPCPCHAEELVELRTRTLVASELAASSFRRANELERRAATFSSCGCPKCAAAHNLSANAGTTADRGLEPAYSSSAILEHGVSYAAPMESVTLPVSTPEVIERAVTSAGPLGAGRNLDSDVDTVVRSLGVDQSQPSVTSRHPVNSVYKTAAQDLLEDYVGNLEQVPASLDEFSGPSAGRGRRRPPAAGETIRESLEDWVGSLPQAPPTDGPRPAVPYRYVPAVTLGEEVSLQEVGGPSEGVSAEVSGDAPAETSAGLPSGARRQAAARPSVPPPRSPRTIGLAQNDPEWLRNPWRSRPLGENSAYKEQVAAMQDYEFWSGGERPTYLCGMDTCYYRERGMEDVEDALCAACPVRKALEMGMSQKEVALRMELGSAGRRLMHTEMVLVDSLGGSQAVAGQGAGEAGENREGLGVQSNTLGGTEYIEL